ncbi:MAG: phosphoribulokinase [Hyphomicrobiaceae bacterium]|nr:phosphoribulokinase [Hyphomicrobiaceae bacterium]
MSARHPIITVTGTAGDATEAVRETFAHIFDRERIAGAFIDGSGFHRYDRAGMEKARREAQAAGDRYFSQFGPDANLLSDLEQALADYGERGHCRSRSYADTPQAASRMGLAEGTFSTWKEIGEGSELLVYQGVHGALKTNDFDIAKHADLKIGIVPVVNLEWIEKIHRDNAQRGTSAGDVTETILRRMSDYVSTIVPQFSRTDINFQRVPVVDTSNPFIARWVPSADETKVVIRFRNPRGIDFAYLVSMIHDSYMSRANSIVIPGGKLDVAMQLILTPMISKLLERKRRAHLL